MTSNEEIEKLYQLLRADGYSHEDARDKTAMALCFSNYYVERILGVDTLPKPARS